LVTKINTPNLVGRLQGEEFEGQFILSDSLGNLFVKQNISENIEGGGKVSVGTTAVAVTFTGTTTSVIISSDINNTGVLYIGKSTVTNLGANAFCFLQAGESVTIDYNDATNALYVVSDTASQYFWKGALL
jgi:hypothetical protein